MNSHRTDSGRARTPADPEPETRSPLIPILLALAAIAPWGTSLGDALSAPPAPWSQGLAPIPDTDISGAEPLMQETIVEARKQLETLLLDAQSDPKVLARAYGRLGAILVLLEVEAPADLAFRNAQTLDPGEPRWPYYAGYLAMMSGNGDKALDHLETARAIDPSYVPVYLRLGKVQLDTNALEAARTNLERAAETPGLASAAHYYLGQIANLERRYRDAVDHLESALAADPQATQVHWPLGQAYRALGKDDEARAHLRLVSPRTPEARDPFLAELKGAARQSVPAFERAVQAVGQRDFQEAADEFANGLAVDPDNQAARVSYARVLYLTGDPQGAARELELARSTAPAPPLAAFFQAVIAQASGDAETAASLYQSVLAQEPGHGGALFHLANLDLAAGRFAQAEAGYQAALASDQAPPPARLLVIISGHRRGTSERQSAERIADLVASSPGDPGARYAQIRLLAAARDPAVRDIDRAQTLASILAFEQPGPHALRALALTQAVAGELAAARATQTQALTMGGGWLPPDLQGVMERELKRFQEGTWDQDPWPREDPALAPQPLDAMGVFRDYPAAVPY